MKKKQTRKELSHWHWRFVCYCGTAQSVLTATASLRIRKKTGGVEAWWVMGRMLWNNIGDSLPNMRKPLCDFFQNMMKSYWRVLSRNRHRQNLEVNCLPYRLYIWRAQSDLKRPLSSLSYYLMPPPSMPRSWLLPVFSSNRQCTSF